MRGTWMLSFHLLVPPPSLPPTHSFLPSHTSQVPPILLFPILSSFLLQSAAGGEPQAGSEAASGAEGGPPRLGLRWVLEAATPEAGPDSPAPRPGRPTPQCATHWTRDAGVTGMSEDVGGGRPSGPGPGGPGEGGVWSRRGTLGIQSGWPSM